MLAELFPRTVLAIAAATALVAIAIAFDLPRLTPEAQLRAPVRSGSEFILRSSTLLHEFLTQAPIAATRAADPALRTHATTLIAASEAQLNALTQAAGGNPGIDHDAPHALRRLTGLAPEQIDRVFAPDALAVHQQLARISADVAHLKPPVSPELLAVATTLASFHQAAASDLQRNVASATPSTAPASQR
jgi:hypothetical protein